MKIEVLRLFTDAAVTLSKIFIDGDFFCYGLEDPVREKKIYAETAIPEGIYKVGTRWSPKFSKKHNHDMLWVKEVPNYEYILIHWGNTIKDTAGCLLVGNRLGALNGQVAILNSLNTYKQFYEKVIAEAKAGTLTIEYKSL